jgi:hypothetical protein
MPSVFRSCLFVPNIRSTPKLSSLLKFCLGRKIHKSFTCRHLTLALKLNRSVYTILTSSCFFYRTTSSMAWQPWCVRASSLSRLHDHTHSNRTFGRIPLNGLGGWSAYSRDLYLQHTTLITRISMLRVGFKPTLPASKTPKTHALGRAASGIGGINNTVSYCSLNSYRNSLFTDAQQRHAVEWRHM